MARRSKPQADGVYAISLIGGGGVSLASEDMPQVRIAGRAADFDTEWPRKGAVLHVDDPILCKGFEEARPTAVGGKFCLTAEQLGSASSAFIHSLGAGISVFTREGGFCT